MAHPVVITIIIIVILIAILVITGYISDPIIDIPTLFILGFLLYRTTRTLIKSRHLQYYSYKGKIGRALEDIKENGEGYIIVDGEWWRARALEDIKKGDEVEVLDRKDLTLIVRKKRKEENVSNPI
ncbi:MAG: NfeD family protein [Sulfolobaceae archaeon]|nr:NfeD family protein [Sulfolobaceae archaeon]